MAERNLAEIREWISERRDHETRVSGDTAQAEDARDAAHGAVETLDALTAFLDGDNA